MRHAHGIEFLGEKDLLLGHVKDSLEPAAIDKKQLIGKSLVWRQKAEKFPSQSFALEPLRSVYEFEVSLSGLPDCSRGGEPNIGGL